MEVWPFILVFGVGLATALIGTALAGLWGYRIGLVDQPEDGRRHRGVIPRTGGLALFAAFMAAALLGQWLPVPRFDPAEPTRIVGVALGGCVALVVGHLDDRFDLPPWLQLLGQGLAALVAIVCIVFIQQVRLPFTDQLLTFPYWFTVLLSLFWIVGMINTVNFLDGLDGLAGGVAAIVSAVLVVDMLRGEQYSVALLPLALLGATLGFLPYNVHPARVFMGSTGSYVAGFALGTLSIVGGPRLGTILLVLSIPIVDVAWLILQRARTGRSIGHAERWGGHLHYRLLNLGLGQTQIVGLYWALCASFGVLSLVIESRPLKLATVVALGVGIFGFLAWLARQELRGG
jgi:UDP-GlcNAc:undecaprenyl-phosphate GlcNAc-1-phosphate transferase